RAGPPTLGLRPAAAARPALVPAAQARLALVPVGARWCSPSPGGAASACPPKALVGWPEPVVRPAARPASARCSSTRAPRRSQTLPSLESAVAHSAPDSAAFEPP